MRVSNIRTQLTVPALFICLSVLTAGCRRPDVSEQMKPILEKYVQAWNTGDFQGLDNIVSEQFELRMSPKFETVRSLDSLKRAITYWRTAYPDFNLTLDEVLCAASAVSCRWTIHATNSGPGKMPPTGKSVVVPGMSILHVSAGKITDEWIFGNDLYWMMQLGFTVAPPASGK